MALRVVLDTNVVVAGLRSRTGASFVALELVGRGELRVVVNAPLLDEYEEVLRRPGQRPAHGLSGEDLRRFLRGLLAEADLVGTRLDRRLTLVRDPGDAVVAEAANDGGADHLVTHNLRHLVEVGARVGRDAWEAAEDRGVGVSTKTAYPLKMSASLKKAVARLAAEDGVSLNHWINMAVAQKVGAVETAASLPQRFGEAQPGDLRSALDKVPDNPPMPGDEVPEELRAGFGRT